MRHIAIPSVGRAGRARTVEQLESLQGAAEVTWYVRPDQEADYRRRLPGWHGVLPRGGLKNEALNNIFEDYAGQDVLCMDDDIPWFIGCRAVFSPRPGNAPKTPRLHALDVATMGFGALNATGLSVFGVYPVPYSGTALKPRVGVGTVFLIGQCFGVRVPSGGMPFRLSLHSMEDYQFTAKSIDHWGAVVRLDLVCAYTVSGAGAGGMQDTRTDGTEAIGKAYLVDRWPNLFSAAPDRNGLPQVAMITDVQWHAVNPEEGWHG